MPRDRTLPIRSHSPLLPCRVAALKGVPVACVAAANRHTVIATSSGCVFSWGSNLQGQLGYGTSDSASNATPRVVEVMKVRTGRRSASPAEQQLLD